MKDSVRPYVTSGVAIVGAGILLTTSVSAPPTQSGTTRLAAAPVALAARAVPDTVRAASPNTLFAALTGPPTRGGVSTTSAPFGPAGGGILAGTARAIRVSGPNLFPPNVFAKPASSSRGGAIATVVNVPFDLIGDGVSTQAVTADDARGDPIRALIAYSSAMVTSQARTAGCFSAMAATAVPARRAATAPFCSEMGAMAATAPPARPARTAATAACSETVATAEMAATCSSRRVMP